MPAFLSIALEFQMATQRRRGKRPSSRRIDVKQYGIDLRGLVRAIRPHLDGMTQREISEKAGINLARVHDILNNPTRKPSLGALAALAKASGGKLVVSYVPPRNSEPLAGPPKNRAQFLWPASRDRFNSARSYPRSSRVGRLRSADTAALNVKPL